MQVAEGDYQISALKAKVSDTMAGVVKGTCIVIGMMRESLRDHQGVRGSGQGGAAWKPTYSAEGK